MSRTLHCQVVLGVERLFGVLSMHALLCVCVCVFVQVVELEGNSQRKVTKYLVIITSNGHMGTEETIYLGTEQDGST